MLLVKTSPGGAEAMGEGGNSQNLYNTVCKGRRTVGQNQIAAIDGGQALSSDRSRDYGESGRPGFDDLHSRTAARNERGDRERGTRPVP